MHQIRIKPINIYKVTHHLLVALSLLVLSFVPMLNHNPSPKSNTLSPQWPYSFYKVLNPPHCILAHSAAIHCPWVVAP